MGYAAKSKGYRVYNVKDKKIVISRDVLVDEDSFWNWEENKVQQGKEENQSNVLAANQEEMVEASSQVEPDDPDNSIKGKTKSLAEIYEKCNVALVEPSSYEDAARYKGWVQAMEEEMHMIQKNKTWELVKRPHGSNVLGVKWVYRAKVNPDGSLNKLKARLVVKGYAQQYGVDFGDTFAPVARHDTIRLLIALAAQNK